MSLCRCRSVVLFHSFSSTRPCKDNNKLVLSSFKRQHPLNNALQVHIPLQLHHNQQVHYLLQNSLCHVLKQSLEHMLMHKVRLYRYHLLMVSLCIQFHRATHCSQQLLHKTLHSNNPYRLLCNLFNKMTHQMSQALLRQRLPCLVAQFQMVVYLVAQHTGYPMIPVELLHREY